MSTGWLFGYGDGNRVTEEEVRTRPAGVPFILAYGGGVNSTAVVAALLKIDLRPDLVLFADTGGEYPETYEFVETFARWARKQGLWFVRWRRHCPDTGDHTLEEQCLRLATLPSLAFGGSSCSQKWKIEAQEQFVSGVPGAYRTWGSKLHVLKAIGYDADEEYRATIHADERYRYWYPLIEWSLDRDDCKRAISDAGLTLPKKSSCFFCPAHKPREIVQLADEHPDLFARAVDLEKRARAAGNLSDKVVGLGRHWTWEEVVRLSDEQRAKLPKPPEGCVRCMDGACPSEAA